MTWQPIETAPRWSGGAHKILLKGYSKAGSFAGAAYVGGWLTADGEIVHNYSYKLIITHWMEIPE